MYLRVHPRSANYTGEAVMIWWPWSTKQAQTYTRSNTSQSPGCCEVCSGYGMVCLNGQRFLCWDHYCIEMQAQRTTPEERATQ